MKEYKNKKVNIEIEKETIKLYLNYHSCGVIANRLGISKITARNILKRNNIQIRNPSVRCKKYVCDYLYFKKIDSLEKAYFLGLLYADGWINRLNGEPYGFGISLSGDDELDLLNKFKKVLNYSGNIYKKKKIKESNKQAYTLNVNNREIAKDLIDLGCVPAKSLILKFPTENQVPRNLIHHFIRGYIEGDGAISFKKDNRLLIGIVSSNDFSLSFKKYIEDKLNVYVGIYKRSNNYEIKICGNNALKLLQFIYDNNEVCLKRKKDVYIRYLEFYKDKMLNNVPKNISEDNIRDIYKFLHLPNKEAMYVKFGENKVKWIKKFIEQKVSQRDICKIFKIRFSSFYKITTFLDIKYKKNKYQSWISRKNIYKNKLQNLIDEYKNSLLNK